jgi:Tfp pilus assembly protein PilF
MTPCSLVSSEIELMKSIRHLISTRLRASVAVFAFCSLASTLLGNPASAAVTAYRPSDAAQVILKLNDNGEAQLARLRQATIDRPSDVDARATYVSALLTLGGRTGNERYFGFAEQAIETAPASSRLRLGMLQAQLLQHRHDFRAAERVLTEILDRDPRHLDAVLMRAQVRMHLHEPENALRDCSRLTLNADLLTSMTCVAQAQSAQSTDLAATERAYSAVTSLLQVEGPAATRSWSAGVAGEFAARLGNNDAATRWYRTAYDLDRDSHYARISFADWLLATGNYETAYEVASTGASSADRLRVVLAKRDASSVTSRQLQLSWREAEARGERTHLRDRARFELIVLDDVIRAHATALDNFRDHRESEDALLLAQTAAANSDAKSIAIVRQWQTERRYADRRMNKYLELRE